MTARPADPVVVAALGGDAGAFDELVGRHRRELHVHCYRMVGSFDDAEDLVQDTVVRAWAGRAGFDGSALFRAWLYRIATNACLDFLRSSRRREAVIAAGTLGDGAAPPPSLATMPWVQPYPDRLLDDILVERETIELVYVAALQVLPPRQRALVVLRYVLGWSAPDTARALGLTVAASNSALQRARDRLRAHLPADRRAWVAAPTEPEAADAAVVRRFMDACESYDVDEMVALASDGIRLTAPPDPRTWDGRAAYAAETAEGFGPGAPGVLRCLPTRANRRPAAAIYLRRWDDDTFRPFALSVLRVEGGELAEVTAFGTADFDRFALPAATLPD